MKTLREYIDQLDEISRRDFLKTAGAAAGLAATDALAAPWQHGQSKDEMDNTTTKYSSIVSIDRNAELFVHHVHGNLLFHILRGRKMIDFDKFTDGRGISRGRLKLGNHAPDNVRLEQLSRGGQIYIISSPDYDLTQTLFKIKNPTVVKIEIPFYGGTRSVYTFEIEPDKKLQTLSPGSAQARDIQDRQNRERATQYLDKIQKNQEYEDDIIKRSQNPIVRKDRESGRVNELEELGESEPLDPIEKIDRSAVPPRLTPAGTVSTAVSDPAHKYSTTQRRHYHDMGGKRPHH